MKFLHTKRAMSSTEESSMIERQTYRRRLREAPSDWAPMPTAQQLASIVAMATEAGTVPMEGDTKDLTRGDRRGRETGQGVRAARRLHMMTRTGTVVREIEAVRPGEVTLIHISLVTAAMEAAAAEMIDLQETIGCLETTGLRGMIDTETTDGHQGHEMTGGTTVERIAGAGRRRDMIGGENGSESSETFIGDRSCRQMKCPRIQCPSMLSMMKESIEF